MDDVELDNQTEKFAPLAIVGPKSREVLLAAGLTHAELERLQCVHLNWNGFEVTLIRGDNPSVPEL